MHSYDHVHVDALACEYSGYTITLLLRSNDYLKNILNSPRQAKNNVDVIKKI